LRRLAGKIANGALISPNFYFGRTVNYDLDGTFSTVAVTTARNGRSALVLLRASP
jgi:hypothetical protein